MRNNTEDFFPEKFPLPVTAQHFSPFFCCIAGNDISIVLHLIMTNNLTFELTGSVLAVRGTVTDSFFTNMLVLHLVTW